MLCVLGAAVSPIACGSSREVAAPKGATGDASDGLVRRDDSMEIPCEPRRILMTICQQCHTRPETKNGAPFPLQYRSDVLATYSGVQIRELMIEQLSAGRMPLAPVTIDPNDRTTLLAWLTDGAPPVAPTTCAPERDADVGIDGAVAMSSDGAPEGSTEEDAGSDVVAAPDDGGAEIDAGDDGGVEGQ